MAVRTEDRLGSTALVGTTYISLGQASASDTWNVIVQLVNVTTANILARAYVASSGWVSGAPSATTLIQTVAFDVAIGSTPVHITGIIVKPNERIVVRSDTTASLDATAAGVKRAA